jgi:hypothetical protein
MDINSLGTLQTIRSFDPSQIPPGFQSQETTSDGCTDDFGLNISPAGNMLSMIAGMSEEDKAEMQTFHQDMWDAIESGTFDAAEMAEEAPESMQAFAEENGLDLEEMLTKMAEGGPPPGGPPLGGPPPGGPPVDAYNSEGIGVSDSDTDPTMDLISQLFADEDSDDEALIYLAATQ